MSEGRREDSQGSGRCSQSSGGTDIENGLIYTFPGRSVRRSRNVSAMASVCMLHTGFPQRGKSIQGRTLE